LLTYIGKERKKRRNKFIGGYINTNANRKKINYYQGYGFLMKTKEACKTHITQK
jgi:hypothetical protein